MNYLGATFNVPLWGVILAAAVCVVAGGVVLFLYRRVRGARSNVQSLAQTLEQTSGDLEGLRKSEEKYRHLYESAPVGIFRTTIDGARVLLGNEAAAAMFGYSSVEEFLEHCKPAEVYVHPENRTALIEALRIDGQVADFEILVSRADGSRKYLSLTGRIDTEVGYLEGALLDVTARKRAERELKDSHLFLQTVMDTIPNPLFYKDGSGLLRHVNSAYETFLGTKRSEVLGRSPAALLPPEVARDWEAYSQSLLGSEGEAIIRFDTWLRTQGGSLRNVVVQEGLVKDSAGKRLGLVGVLTDITEMKRIETDLREAWATYRTIFDNALDGIFTTTAEGRFVRANAAMARLLGYDTKEELTNSITDMATQVYAKPGQRLEVLGRLQEDGTLLHHEVEVLRKDGSRLWVSLSLRGIFAEDGALIRVEGVATDVSERKRVDAELTHRALSDPLTGLPNRAAFEREFERMLALAKRSGQQVGVLFMDLDGFKPINDTYGHQTGDELLRAVGVRLKSRLRVSDIAARIGGDEFGVLLWNVSGEETMERIAQEIIDSVNEPVGLDACECQVGVSIGGSLYPRHGDNQRVLIRRADEAMYEVKQSGKNTFRLASELPGDSPESASLSARESGPEGAASGEEDDIGSPDGEFMLRPIE